MFKAQKVFEAQRRLFGIAALATAALAAPTSGADDFPLVGTYTENQPCKADGSDANVARVKITAKEIDSAFGLCTIMEMKRDGNTFSVHVQCHGAGGSEMLGDVNFTLRADKTVDFADQDKTYKAVLHKCPD